LRKKIIKIIKINSDTLFDLYLTKDSKFKERIEYIIKKITDTEYYFINYINNKEYKEYKEKAYNILKKCSFLFHFNKKGETPFLSFDKIKFGNNNDINFDELEKIKQKLTNNNKKLKNSYIKFLDILQNLRKYLEKTLGNDYDYSHIKICLKFNLQNQKENENKQYYCLKCKYQLNINENENIYQDENILSMKSLLDFEGFNCLIDEIKSDRYQIIQIKKILSEHKRQAEFIKEVGNGFLISSGSNDELFLYILDKKENIYRKKTEIKLQYKSSYLHYKDKENNPSKWILNLYELKNNNKEENREIEIITCSKLGFRTFCLNNDGYYHNDKYILNKYLYSCSFFFELNNNSFIIGGEKGINHFSIVNDEKNNEDRIDLIESIGGAFRAGIKINEELFAFSSNSILPKGKDQLIIYNIKVKKWSEINNYSFTVSTNGLTLMTHIETGVNVLLCGCKQYKNNQRNGILLVELVYCYDPNKKQFLHDAVAGQNIPPFEERDTISYNEEFFDTNDFEVYCFCPISIIDKNPKSSIDNNIEENNVRLSPTNYFFVGGFEKDRAEGIIKLFKLKKKSEKKENIKNNLEIEFIQDIIIKQKIVKKLHKIKIYKNGKFSEDERERKYQFDNFSMNISCIIQSKITGELLIILNIIIKCKFIFLKNKG
jgi:hypothetical protein